MAAAPVLPGKIFQTPPSRRRVCSVSRRRRGRNPRRLFPQSPVEMVSATLRERGADQAFGTVEAQAGGDGLDGIVRLAEAPNLLTESGVHVAKCGVFAKALPSPDKNSYRDAPGIPSFWRQDESRPNRVLLLR